MGCFKIIFSINLDRRNVNKLLSLNFSVSLSCGGSSSNNNSYIVQSSTTTSPANPCVYDICPCSTDICRIRYDFTAHTLATQVKGSAHTTGDLTDSKWIFQFICRFKIVLNQLFMLMFQIQLLVIVSQVCT